MKIHFKEGSLKGKTLSFDQASIVIGRSSSCTLVINDPKLSACHLELSQHDDDVWLEDLESHNGVFLNGQRIRQSSRVELGDEITLASEVFSLVEIPLKKEVQEKSLLSLEDMGSGNKSIEEDCKDGVESIGAEDIKIPKALSVVLICIFFLGSLSLFFYESPSDDSVKVEKVHDSPAVINDEVLPDEPENLEEIVEVDLLELNINSDIPGVKLEINGVHRGELPLKLKDLESAFYYVTVYKRAYHKQEFLIDLRSSQSLNIDLQRDENYVDFQTTPPGASLSYKGEVLAKSPSFIRRDLLKAKQLIMSLDNYSSFTVGLDDLASHYEFNPEHCSLSIDLPEVDCEVNLNGKVIDSKNSFIKLEKLIAGEYFLSINVKGSKVKEEHDLIIKAGEDRLIKSGFYVISHRLKLSSGEEYFGMLVDEGFKGLNFTLETGETKFFDSAQILSCEPSSEAESLGISKGIKVVKKKILPLNENIWKPKRYKGPERKPDIKKFTLNEILSDKEQMDLLSFFEKYGNTYLEVSGEVTAISSNEDWHTLRLANELECFFEGQSNDLSRYGKNIVVRGWSLGVRGLDMLVLSECEFVE
ncbi:FHA domain-containing protein [Lentisphaera marina]|uniref:FHA domain-containing protein n=1 Tax=Lentisphaera marina TaxID=1111041 RepID=UPI0023653ED0|nr:FHA domain-containing protein [Lentisphaera marina]MDD7984733.1 FHA domain-containing protein [Lentisphaera marina]